MSNMFWIDLETSGLNPQTEIILEVGCMVTDELGNEKDHHEWLIKHDPEQYNWGVSCDPFVKNMHLESGLFQDVILDGKGSNELDVWSDLESLMLAHGLDKDPMCGSSIQFDRAFMEWHAPISVVNRFHYRNIDVTSTIETMKLVAPSLFSLMEKECPSREKHRVRPDLEDTVRRYQWLLDMFYNVPSRHE